MEIQQTRNRRAERGAAEELPGLLEIAGRAELDPAGVEDAVCVRLGEIMHRYDAHDHGDLARLVEPDRMLGAVTDAVLGALGAPAEISQVAAFGPGGTLFAAWRLWEALREISPQGQAAAMREHEDVLRSRFGELLPERAGRSGPLGAVRWARDAYGSRFLIAAEFEQAGRRRWYAWDVDACGYEPMAVAAGFFDSCESAIEEWRGAVGDTAAGSSAFAPVRHAAEQRLAATLLPDVEGFARMGGESAAQMSDYHRSRRLAQSVRSTPEWMDATAEHVVQASTDPQRERGERFVTWLAGRRPEREFAEDFAETAAELADTWAGASQDEGLFLTCSPHRVVGTSQAIGDYYLDEFAAELQALFPDWVRWIAEQTGLPDSLLERSLEYCDGRTHPAQKPEERELNWYARCVE